MLSYKTGFLGFKPLALIYIAIFYFTIAGETPAMMNPAAGGNHKTVPVIMLDQSLTLKGTAIYAGAPQDWTLIINGDGRAISKTSGKTHNVITGYDGTSVWRIENGAGPFSVDFAEREVWIMTLLFLVGREETATSLSDNAGGNKQFQLSDGELIFQWGESGQLIARDSPNKEGVIFTGGSVPNHDGLPQVIQIQNIGEFSEYQISSAKIGPAKDDSVFSRPKRKTEGFRFLSNIDAEFEVRQSNTGHMFVRPLVDGKELGWFLFDTAAGFSGLSTKAAETLGFEKTMSKPWLGGIGNPGEMVAQYTGGPLQLGALQIDNLTFLDVGEMRKMGGDMTGETIVGVLGWDILARAIIEYDLRDGRLFLHDPDKYRIPAAHRSALYIHWKVPYAIGRFAGGFEGPFMLDTGAGNLGVVFTSYSVERFNLLQKSEPEGIGDQGGPDAGEGMSMSMSGDQHGPDAGEGMSMGMSMVMGQIDWFEIGGHRTAPAPAMFHLGEDYESDIFTLGILGGGVITPFRVILDYGRGEVGFVPRD